MATTDSPEPFVRLVQRTLKEQERSMGWLAKKTGIPPSTLGYQLDNPGAISLRNAYRIANVLGISIDRSEAGVAV